jgi:hypothetical protein
LVAVATYLRLRLRFSSQAAAAAKACLQHRLNALDQSIEIREW